jgi:single-stranded-DNA-specific exonuclease
MDPMIDEAMDAPPNGVPALVHRLLVARGIDSAEAQAAFLDPRLSQLHDPGLLPGIDRAVERLMAALKGGERIVIYGDYDVDGVTATAILYHTLRCAVPGAKIESYVPHRVDEGYGLNAEAMEKIATDGPAVVISVDCGVTAVEPAARAKALGLDLIITDHHALAADGGELPDAYAIVHPGLPGSAYPFADLCGAGVAYKVAWRLATTWCGSERVSKAFRDVLIECLPLAALGTIADVVPLVDENRVIARWGLTGLRRTSLTGLRALLEASELTGKNIDAYKVGFILGPRLNACGRMGHASEAVEMLTRADDERAMAIARQLNQLNKERQDTERLILNQAIRAAEQSGQLGDDSRVVVLAQDGWHPGVVGIVCSRIVDRYGRPTILMGEDGGVCAGSGRSIDGFDLHEAISACGEHLLTYGGHAMAAGLKCEASKLDAFRDALHAYAMAHLDPALLAPTLRVDCDARLTDMNHAVVEQIESMSPFGRGNPAARVRLRDLQIVGRPESMGRYGSTCRFACSRRARRATWCGWWGSGSASTSRSSRRVSASMPWSSRRSTGGTDG